MVKIVCISDTHFMHGLVDIEECDLLIHSGDYSDRGEEYQITSLNNWFGKLKSSGKVKQIITTCGNHELTFCSKMREYNEYIKKILSDPYYGSNCIYLENAGCEVMGLKVYASPATPEFCSWGNNFRRGPELDAIWAKIPDDTQVLITHGPPYSIGDFLPIGWSNEGPEEIIDPNGADSTGLRYVGCEDLRRRINQLDKLRLHVFGHIHFASGMYDIDGFRIQGNRLDKTMMDGFGKVFVNASVCTEEYKVLNPPIVVEI